MLNKFTSGLFLVILIELILGGGRLVSIGPVSLRMVLFGLAMATTFIHLLLGNRIERKYVNLLLIYSGMLTIGISTGLLAGADKKLIWEDVKPLLFFYLLPFFALVIQDEKDLKKIGRTIITSSGIMAIVFLILFLLLVTDTLHFLNFYHLTEPTGELFFRGEYSFFYKGFVYLGVGLIFTHFLEGAHRWWLLALFVLTIGLTLTRGLLFALGLVYVFYFSLTKQFPKGLAAGLFCVVVLFFGKQIYSAISEQLYHAQETALSSPPAVNKSQESGERRSPLNPALSDKLLGDRESSDNVRKVQVKQVTDSLTWASALWGHGFGNGVGIRPIHMEISYLEIFHKQGILGLACWALIFLALVVPYWTGMPATTKTAHAFFLSALFIFCQSLTNQYVNNPLGMGMVLISLVSLNVLRKEPGSAGQDPGFKASIF